MKRNHLFALALALALTAVTGCGGGSTPASSVAPAPASSSQATLASSSEAASSTPAASAPTTPADKSVGWEPTGDVTPMQTSWKPEKQITFLVGNSAGGGADVFARTLAKCIADNNLCEQPIVILNKPGGSHSVAWSWLSEQKGDCYTLGTISSSFYTQPLTGNSPVHPDDFTKVVHLCKDPALLVVPGNSPYNTMEELLAYAKDHPDELKLAGSSNMSDDNFICELLNKEANVAIEYVPFGSGGDILAAALGGHVDVSILGPSEANEHVLNGDLKVLAACAFDRLDILPDVPTLAELGYNVTQQQSRGMAMEKEVPEEVIAYYSELLLKASQTAQWKEYLATNCMVEMPMNYKEYAQYDKEIIDNYTALIAAVQAES